MIRDCGRNKRRDGGKAQGETGVEYDSHSLQFLRQRKGVPQKFVGGHILVKQSIDSHEGDSTDMDSLVVIPDGSRKSALLL